MKINLVLEKITVNFAVNKVLWELENEMHIIGIFIDLSKAFYTISHDKLRDKLNNYGIRGKGLQILKSYLQKRTQQKNTMTAYLMNVLLNMVSLRALFWDLCYS